MPRYIDANKAIELLRAYKTSDRPNAYEQGINRGIKLACWILSDNRVLPNVLDNWIALPHTIGNITFYDKEELIEWVVNQQSLNKEKFL